MVYIVNVLTGVHNERILANHHDVLSTFNIGGELSVPEWIKLARALINAGYLKEEEKFPFEKLTLTGRAPRGAQTAFPHSVGADQGNFPNSPAQIRCG